MVDLLLLLCAHKPFLLLIIILDICSKDVAFFFKLLNRIAMKFSDLPFFSDYKSLKAALPSMNWLQYVIISTPPVAVAMASDQLLINFNGWRFP